MPINKPYLSGEKDPADLAWELEVTEQLNQLEFDFNNQLEVNDIASLNWDGADSVPENILNEDVYPNLAARTPIIGTQGYFLDASDGIGVLQDVLVRGDIASANFQLTTGAAGWFFDGESGRAYLGPSIMRGDFASSAVANEYGGISFNGLGTSVASVITNLRAINVDGLGFSGLGVASIPTLISQDHVLVGPTTGQQRAARGAGMTAFNPTSLDNIVGAIGGTNFAVCEQVQVVVLITSSVALNGGSIAFTNVSLLFDNLGSGANVTLPLSSVTLTPTDFEDATPFQRATVEFVTAPIAATLAASSEYQIRLRATITETDAGTNWAGATTAYGLGGNRVDIYHGATIGIDDTEAHLQVVGSQWEHPSAIIAGGSGLAVPSIDYGYVNAAATTGAQFVLEPDSLYGMSIAWDDSTIGGSANDYTGTQTAVITFVTPRDIQDVILGIDSGNDDFWYVVDNVSSAAGSTLKQVCSVMMRFDLPTNRVDRIHLSTTGAHADISSQRIYRIWKKLGG